ncbi:MAG TPA: branched-chain amino acid ABC transporter substrate-binding protein [Gaiellaceae bacterium]
MQRRRAALAAVVVVVAALVVAAGAYARSDSSQSAGTAAVSCKNSASIGMLAPITGPAGSIGSDQLHWAQFYVSLWNKNPRNKVKLKLIQGDTQLDPSKASTVAQQFASNSSIVGIIGPAGSQEVIATSPIFKKAGLAFISGSATKVSLTDGRYRGFFYRVVPNDGRQGPGAANFMMSNLGVKKGDTVMIVDDQEAYSTGLAGIVQSVLKSKGVKVQRESISQKATDFSSLVAKAGSAKVVFAPFQLASQAQLLAQQLKAQGKQAPVFGSDGTFDSSKFNVSGSYVSFFAPDVTTLPEDKAIVAAFHKQFPGGTSPFGAPNYVAAEILATAVSGACADGTASRAEVRSRVAKVALESTILGDPIAFTRNGDVANVKYHIFKIEGGKYIKVV